MSVTVINCPNCRQPIQADVKQLFDVSQEPTAKQILLSGAYNIVQCPHCGYQGNIASPIVYHDSDKELLLTFFPPEVSVKRDDQERLIGSLINRVVNNLPQEKRKGYLLRPQSALTMQGLVERILEADGITKEMIEAQQRRLALIQRLLNTSEENRAEITTQEDELIDVEFFTLLSRLGESALASGDQDSAKKLADLQRSLLETTTFGRQIGEQTKEVEAAIASLQEAGQELTREKLLELIIQAPNEHRLNALVSLARPGMDYSFFQMLSERIDRSRGDGRARLIELRDKLLELTQEIDHQMEARAQQSRNLLESILNEADVEQATIQSLPAVDEFFVQHMNERLESARSKGDLDLINKIQKIQQVIEEASAAPPEIAFIEEMLGAKDDQSLRELLEANQEKVTPELLDALTNILAQMDSSQNQDLSSRLRKVQRSALRFSMEMKLKE